MSRPPGSRNKDFEASRQAIVLVLQAHLREHPDPQLSFRQLAELAGVSVPTLRHYFGDAPGVFAAVMRRYREDGEPFIRAAAEGGPAELAASLQAFAQDFLLGWRFGVRPIHELGLAAGLGDPTLGPLYVDALLEPTTQALEARLARHAATGALPLADFRHAALCFIAPLFLALLHQDTLGGRGCRPLDLQAFADDHVARFLRAWGPEPC
jgi:AcrR family transcriptional regulator